MEVGLTDILKTKDQDVTADCTFSSRGQQRLTLSGDFDKFIKGFKLTSTFMFDSYVKDVSQATTFTYQFDDKTSTELNVNLSERYLEVAGSIARDISQNLKVTAYAGYSLETRKID